MPAKGIRVDRSFDCAIRTASTEVASTAPGRVPIDAMRGRRWIRILNNGRLENGVRVNVKVMIGVADALLASASQQQGFGLDIDEFVDLPFDDSIIVYGIAEAGETSDLRTIELR